jgi:hypothetical protein
MFRLKLLLATPYTLLANLGQHINRRPMTTRTVRTFDAYYNIEDSSKTVTDAK